MYNTREMSEMKNIDVTVWKKCPSGQQTICDINMLKIRTRSWQAYINLPPLGYCLTDLCVKLKFWAKKYNNVFTYHIHITYFDCNLFFLKEKQKLYLVFVRISSRANRISIALNSKIENLASFKILKFRLDDCRARV